MRIELVSRLRVMQRWVSAEIERISTFAAVLTFVTAQVLIPGAALAAEASVTITTALAPAVLEIAPGTTVTWTNSDDEEHRVRSQTGPDEFDSGNLDPGETFSFTFALDGTYTYIDDRNDDDTNYHGTVIVSTVIDPNPGDPGDPAPPPPPAPVAGDVSIVDRNYSPTTIEIAAGGSVTWANNDSEEHTVTANDSSWDSGVFDTGGTYSRTFQTAGSFGYFCLIHPDMTGTVVVTGTGGTPPTDPPAPDPTPPPGEDPTPPPVEPPPAGPSDVAIVDFGFEPGSITVGTGATVTWSNNGVALHTVTATDGTSDSGFLFAGDTYSKSFASPGSFSYFCTLHPAMTGTITITGAASPPGSEPPANPPPPSENPPPVENPPSVAGSGDVNIVDNSFGPASITVGAGATLSWLNKGALPHTVTARNGSFDSGIVLSGGRFTRTFVTPGTYSYFCTIHPEMTGTVFVTGADGEAPPEDPLDLSVGDQTAPTVGPSSVRIVDNDYEPGSITVGIGQRVSFANAGSLPHTVTAREGTFDSGILLPGDSFTVTSTSEGSIAYFCTIHPEMAGTINVTSEVVDGGAEELEPEENPDGGVALADVAAPEDDVEVSQSVRIVDLDYDPRVVTVEAGEGILWRNMGELPHTVTDRAGEFDSGILQNGETFTHVFPEVGTFEYFCTLHPDMIATVVVAEATPDLASVAPISAGPPSDAFAYVLAGGLVGAMIVFVVGMTRFIRTVETQ